MGKSILTGSAIGSLNTAMMGPSVLVSNNSDSTEGPGLGFGKLSGSLDEFRFWKTKELLAILVDIGLHK